MTKLKEYLRADAAAEHLSATQDTFRKRASHGSIPMQRDPVNDYRLFGRSDLDSFLKKRPNR